MVFCTSRDDAGGYRGRVTSFIREHPIESDRLCYLCGSADMIYEMHAILTRQGIPREHIFAEIYF